MVDEVARDRNGNQGRRVKTKERVILVSLALFNRFGEPNVTTLQIADEMDISPGNLYYHYKNKTEIVAELYNRFEAEMLHLLDVPDIDISIEDQWLFLHLMSECVARYCFLYKDLVNILQRYERLGLRFRKLLQRKEQAVHALCRSLERQGVMHASDSEREALCRNMVLTLTYWPSFDLIRRNPDDGRIDLALGVHQTMSMLAPFLRDIERRELEALSRAYL